MRSTRVRSDAIPGMFWSVMHTKRGAIFSSPLGRENIVANFGVHIILYALFPHPYIFKKPAKTNGANTVAPACKVYVLSKEI